MRISDFDSSFILSGIAVNDIVPSITGLYCKYEEVDR